MIRIQHRSRYRRQIDDFAIMTLGQRAFGFDHEPMPDDRPGSGIIRIDVANTQQAGAEADVG